MLRLSVVLFVTLFVVASPAATQSSRLAKVAKKANDWLVRHQRADGMWSAVVDVDHCKDLTCSDDLEIESGHDVGVTALAVLALIASEGEAKRHRDVVNRALDAIVAGQGESGDLAPNGSVGATYDHFVSSLALAEAVVLLDDVARRSALERAVTHIESIRQPCGGWRYREAHPEMEDQRCDASATSWALHALIAADHAGVEVDAAAVAEGLVVLENLTEMRNEQSVALVERDLWVAENRMSELQEQRDEKNDADVQEAIATTVDDIAMLKQQLKAATGATGYIRAGDTVARLSGFDTKFPSSLSRACTGAALSCRLSLSETDELDEMSEAMLHQCLLVAPDDSRPGGFDLYGWAYTSMCVGHSAVKQAVRRRWETDLERVLRDVQVSNRCAKGSFDPKQFVWGHAMGRVYQTAIASIAAQATSGRHGLMDR